MTKTKWIEGWEEKLAALEIKGGCHETREKGMCVMEGIAWLRSQKHTDHPACVSPVITRFMQSWNDSLRSEEERARLLKPLIPMIVDTYPASEEKELRRSYMALDWLARVHCPAFLELTDSLKVHAAALSGLSPITDKPSLDAARDKINAAWAAARDAAWDAAWAAARDAAGDAARDAAGDAARRRLEPTISKLQESAQDLVRRMAAVE